MDRRQDILIGPRTTVYALLEAYPFLEPLLLRRTSDVERLSDPHVWTRWARVTTLHDLAVRLNLPLRRMMQGIADEVRRETGRPARLADAPRRIADDGRRLGELRDIIASLEEGASLDETAGLWRAATSDLEQAEEAALEAALSGEAGAGRLAGTRAVRDAAALGREQQAPPPGHPLGLARQEAGQLRRLCADLEAGLERLGGSPTRRRWGQEKPLIDRLAGRLAGVESRFRRQQQAWFPALAVHGVEGPRTLLAARQHQALESLRRLRLAVERDDASSAAEAGVRFVTELHDLLAQDERVLEPLALRHFSERDWAVVRELEDGVGWALVEAPPRWPRA